MRSGGGTVMDQKNWGSFLAASAVLHFGAGPAFAEGRDETARLSELKALTQRLIEDECAERDDFSLDAWDWDAYEAKAFAIILARIIENTQDFCQPPELAGMHAVKRNVGEDTVKETFPK